MRQRCADETLKELDKIGAVVSRHWASADKR